MDEFGSFIHLGTKANLSVRRRHSNSRKFGLSGSGFKSFAERGNWRSLILEINSNLRACDLLKLKVRDVSHGERIAARAIVVQQKTTRPVQFEITEPTRTALADWIARSCLASDDFLFPSRVHASPHLSTRQYARIVNSWVEEIGLDPAAYGTHSIRRTKPSLIYRRTKNLRAVQLLLEMATSCPRQPLKLVWLPVPPALRRSGADRATA